MPVAQCAPQLKRPVWFGNMPVLSEKGPGAEITDVTLADAKTVDLQDSFLVPTNGQPMGTTSNPSRDAPPGWDWDRRIAAVGAVLPATGQQYDLVLQVVRSGPQGSFASVRLRYDWNGKQYVATYPISLTLTDRPCSEVNWQSSST